LMSDRANVAILGLWHQGVVAAACMADWGYDVVAADRDEARIARLSDGKAPLFEPGLDELLRKGLTSGRLRFTSDVPGAVAGRPFVLVMFDTPVDADDRSDLSEIMRTVQVMGPALADGVTIHVTAQVPVGTCDDLAGRIRAARPSLRFGMAYSPENLRLGQAIERFRKPSLPVIGSDDPEVIRALETLYAPCGVKWQSCDLRTAEMGKHALNGFLAISVCFANELGNLCDEVGADGYRLAQILRLEDRIGAKAMLFPGLGFSGGTLARDMQTLRAIGDRSGVDTLLLDGAWQSNQQQNRSVVRRLKALWGGGLQGRRIAVLGLTYKPDTSTLRRSAALEVIAELVRAGAMVSASDPMADRTELALENGFSFHEDALAAARNADALVLMTPWEQYRALDFKAVRHAMKGDVIFDTANFWKVEAVVASGMKYLCIGRGLAAGV